MRRARRGGTVLEFALILPVFLALVGAIIDVSWLFYMETVLDRSVMLGCRAGSLVDPGEDEENIAVTKAAAEDGMTGALWTHTHGLTVDPEKLRTEVDAVGSSPGRSLTCAMSLEYEPLIGLVMVPVSLGSSTAIRLEWQRSAS